MSHLAVCRVCLIGNVKIHSIRNTSLQELYQKLTNYKLTTKDKRPETLCFNCLAQLQRYHRFIVRSQKSKEILTQLSDNGIEILQETVAILNKDIQRDYCMTAIETYNSRQNEQATIQGENIEVEEEIMTENGLPDENCETAVAEAALCRVCLVGDVKTYSVRNAPLQLIYEKLINTKLSTTVGRDDIVCFMCHWQLCKCRKFINKSKKSENVLTELFRNGIQLSQNTVTLLNRQIKSNLETATVESISYYTSPGHQPEYTENDDLVCEEQNHFECNECDYTCTRKILITDHLQRHDPKRRYECDICRYRYLSLGEMKKHKRNVHLFKYTCKECDTKFVNKRQFKKHMRTHADSTTCKKCKKKFKNIIKLRKHYERVHPKYPCERCAVSFTSERLLSDHVLKTHAIHFPFYICDLCDRKYKQKGSMRKHMTRVHLKIGKHECDTCKKVLRSKFALKEHLRRHAKLKMFKCKLCPKTFIYSSQFSVHMKLHSGVKPYTCEICNKSFPQKYTLKIHYTTHNRLTCDICGKQYSRKSFLTEHIINHMTGLNNTYNCVKCSKKFPLNEQLKIHMYSHRDRPKKEVPSETCEICNKQSKNLKIHMRLHTGEKPYSCKVCGKSYTCNAALYTHAKKHIEGVSKDRPHVCPTCGKRFKRKPHLVIHMSTHSDVKPYACELCDRSYHLLSTFNTHMRKHKEKTMFSCEQCGRSFSEKRSLASHITISHPSEKAQRYVCDMCFKVHIDKKALIVHLKSHKKTKPYRCDSEKCKKTFSKISRLAQHYKEHVKDKQYVCTLCKKMILRSSLMRHYRTKHGAIKPYACNSCDEDFVHFVLVYSHYRRFHSEHQYVCEYCEKPFKRGGSMRKHIGRMHRK